MIAILRKYSDFYQKRLPDNPIALLKDLPKEEVILTIAKINSLLQPIGYRSYDDTREAQIKCLKTILLPNEKQASERELNKFHSYVLYFLKKDKSHFLFSRVTCLYALNEIVQSNVFLETDKRQYTIEERKPILAYLLVCNEYIIDFSEKNSLEEVVEKKIDFFLFNAFNQIPHNQYYDNTNLLLKFYKSKYFLKTLSSDEDISKHLRSYLTSRFGSTDFVELFKRFFWAFMKMENNNLEMYFLKISSDENAILDLMKGFSSTILEKKVDHKDINILDFLTLKKNPVIKVRSFEDNDIITFLILDQKFLLEKFDSLLINDFWFDYLKSKTSINRADWGNWIGKEYFEPLIGETLSEALKDSKCYTLKLYDDLKLEYKGREKIEVADVYIRKKQNVLLGEVKSNYINLINGYKSMNSVEKFKKLDLERFYELFGIRQLAKKTLKEFHSYKKHLNDEGLNLSRKIHLYPVIIVNEPILSSGLFQFPLRTKFEEILREEGIERKTKNHFIWPLLIIRTQELMELEQSLLEGSIDLFRILQSFHDKVEARPMVKQHKFNELLSLSAIINEKIEPKKFFPKRLRDYRWVISENEGNSPKIDRSK